MTIRRICDFRRILLWVRPCLVFLKFFFFFFPIVQKGFGPPLTWRPWLPGGQAQQLGFSDLLRSVDLSAGFATKVTTYCRSKQPNGIFKQSGRCFLDLLQTCSQVLLIENRRKPTRSRVAVTFNFEESWQSWQRNLAMIWARAWTRQFSLSDGKTVKPRKTHRKVKRLSSLVYVLSHKALKHGASGFCDLCDVLILSTVVIHKQ